MDIYIILFIGFLASCFFAYLDYRTKHSEWPKSEKKRILLRTFLFWVSPITILLLLGHPKKRVLEKTHLWYLFIGYAIIFLVLFFTVFFINKKDYLHQPEYMGENEEVSEKLEDKTADWKTYRNEEYGFEIKHLKEWEVSKTSKEVMLQRSLYYKNLLSEAMFCYHRGDSHIAETLWCGVLASVYLRPTDLTLREFYEAKEKLYGLKFKIQREEDFILGNQIHAVKFIFTSTKPDELTSEVIVAVEKEGEIIEIKDKWGRSLEPKDPEFIKTFNQMLSTFKFLD